MKKLFFVCGIYDIKSLTTISKSLKMSVIIVETTDCGQQTINFTGSIHTSQFIKEYVATMDINPEYIDITGAGHHNLSAAQVQRFYGIWQFLTGTAEGREFLEKADNDYFIYRNWHFDKCWPAEVLALMKADATEISQLADELVRQTTVDRSELMTNETTKAYIDSGFVGMDHFVQLAAYALFLSCDVMLRMTAQMCAGFLKRLSNVFPMPPNSSLGPDGGLAITDGISSSDDGVIEPMAVEEVAVMES